MQLPRLSEEQRRPEQEIKDAFNRLHPQFLGLICDAISIVLANLDGVVVEKAPRMADFAKLAMAAAPAFGVSSEQFLEAYRANRNELERDAIESSVVGILVEKLMTTKPHFKGTASKLLPVLRKLAGDRQYDRTFPQKENVLSGQLRRIAGPLQSAGSAIDFYREGHEKIRIIEIQGKPQKETVRKSENHSPLRLRKQRPKG